jgi:pimeloyl-ACP methyl ester carboxylesterase
MEELYAWSPYFAKVEADHVGQDAPTYTLKDYGYKRVSDDIAELARQLGCKHIILGGHDWYA